MSPFEPSDFTEKLIQRTESARRTLRQSSSDELRALVRELFPDGTHPWAAEFSKFIEEHSAEPALRGEAGEGISFVYYPQSKSGVWYRYIGKALAVGLLGQTDLKLLSEIMPVRLQ
ncbi:MAG: hypothetical protein WB586_15595 [Chthoniobacterales bacterium]